MTKAQSSDRYLWSVTKWWPRLHTMKEDIEKHLINKEITLQKELFPKLRHDLSKEHTNECLFKNVELLPGWMVVKEAEEVNDITKKRLKETEWVERTPADCLEEMGSLCETTGEKVQSRYNKSVGKAARILGSCFYIPITSSSIMYLPCPTSFN